MSDKIYRRKFFINATAHMFCSAYNIRTFSDTKYYKISQAKSLYMFRTYLMLRLAKSLSLTITLHRQNKNNAMQIKIVFVFLECLKEKINILFSYKYFNTICIDNVHCTQWKIYSNSLFLHNWTSFPKKFEQFIEAN